MFCLKKYVDMLFAMDNEHDTMNLARELLTPCGYGIPAVRTIGDNVSDDAFRRIFSREENDGNRRIVREALRRYGPDLRAELAQRTQGVWPSGVPVLVPAPPKSAGPYAERCGDAALGIVEEMNAQAIDANRVLQRLIDPFLIHCPVSRRRYYQEIVNMVSPSVAERIMTRSYVPGDRQRAREAVLHYAPEVIANYTAEN